MGLQFIYMGVATPGFVTEVGQEPKFMIMCFIINGGPPRFSWLLALALTCPEWEGRAAWGQLRTAPCAYTPIIPV